MAAALTLTGDAMEMRYFARLNARTWEGRAQRTGAVPRSRAAATITSAINP
jgi:hypothetical protein